MPGYSLLFLYARGVWQPPDISFRNDFKHAWLFVAIRGYSCMLGEFGSCQSGVWQPPNISFHNDLNMSGYYLLLFVAILVC